jgi:hypothetical protein
MVRMFNYLTVELLLECLHFHRVKVPQYLYSFPHCRFHSISVFATIIGLTVRSIMLIQPWLIVYDVRPAVRRLHSFVKKLRSRLHAYWVAFLKAYVKQQAEGPSTPKFPLRYISNMH